MDWKGWEGEGESSALGDGKENTVGVGVGTGQERCYMEGLPGHCRRTSSSRGPELPPHLHVLLKTKCLRHLCVTFMIP